VGYNLVADNSSFVYLLLPPKYEKCREIPIEFDLTAVQRHPRSSILYRKPEETVFSSSRKINSRPRWCGWAQAVVDSVRDLGVIIDSQLCMDAHVAAHCRGGYYQLRQL